MKKVLFVCIQNSCRSQMAEGFAKALGKDVVEAWSAGSNPSGEVDPGAVQAMKEERIDISNHRSKGLSDLPEGVWDVVVTMGCGDSCPQIPARRRMAWELPDPKDQSMKTFRRVRRKIGRRVRKLIEELTD